MNQTNRIIRETVIVASCFCALFTFLSLDATAAAERFKALSDGTVQDTTTGLTWAASDNGASINWSGAIEYCKNFSGGGHKDWRMPTSSELESLYGKRKKVQGQDYSQSIDVVTTMIKISAPYVWTARRTSDNKAMAFGFNYGVTNRLQRGTGGNRRALPVRSANK